MHITFPSQEGAEKLTWRSTVAQAVESACKAGDPSSIPGSERSTGEDIGYPPQSSGLETPTDGGAWRATVHGVAESDTTEALSLYKTSRYTVHKSINLHKRQGKVPEGHRLQETQETERGRGRGSCVDPRTGKRGQWGAEAGRGGLSPGEPHRSASDCPVLTTNRMKMLMSGEPEGPGAMFATLGQVPN